MRILKDIKEEDKNEDDDDEVDIALHNATDMGDI